jgi:carboxylesterase
MLFPLLVALVAGAIWRHRHLAMLEALTYQHRRLGANGIVIGGEPFVLERASAPAILLLHGAGDTPQSLRYLAEWLYARGFHVAVPLLPGHGRTVRDFNRVTADALTDAARANYEALRATHDWVGVIGLSMGGALAVQLAADRTDVPAVGLLAPYLAMPKRIERAAIASLFWGPLLPIVRSTEGKSVLDPNEQAHNLAYGVFTPGALRALRVTMRRAFERLPRVRVPTLVIQSREDNRITPADAARAFALIGSSDKRLEWITGAAHIITVDYGRAAVFAQLAAFMESHAPPRARVDDRVTSDS